MLLESRLEEAWSSLVMTSEADAAAEAVEGGSGNESAAAGVCPVCLGCLQHCLRHDAISKVADAVREFGYELRSFTLAFSLPVQQLVRERAAWLHAAAISGAGISVMGPSGNKNGVKEAHGPPFEAIVDVKEVLRWAVTDELSKQLGVPMDGASPLMVQLGVAHAPSEGEHHSFVRMLHPAESGYNKRKRNAHGQPPEEDSIRVVRSALSRDRSDNLLKTSALCPPPIPTVPCSVSVSVDRDAVTLTGRYRKYSRMLPQSPWIVEGGRKCAGSVAECITDLAVPLFGASEGKFHSAGREDVDVRMLGTGRPFMVELLAPRTPYRTAAQIAELQENINACGLIEIEGLRECSHAVVSSIMKEGEEAHRKDYRCVVCLSRTLTPADIEKINSTRELVTKQLTPMRVLHRRTLMIRERTIHRLDAVVLGPRMLQLDLTTQAGTYVKEFVHGDFGRTDPSLGSLLGCEADIMQLDVTGLTEVDEVS